MSWNVKMEKPFTFVCVLTAHPAYITRCMQHTNHQHCKIHRSLKNKKIGKTLLTTFAVQYLQLNCLSLIGLINNKYSLPCHLRVSHSIFSSASLLLVNTRVELHTHTHTWTHVIKRISLNGIGWVYLCMCVWKMFFFCIPLVRLSFGRNNI